MQIAEITHADSNRHDVLITVEESPATSIGFGGGLEAGPRLQREEQTGGAQERLNSRPAASSRSAGATSPAAIDRSISIHVWRSVLSPRQRTLAAARSGSRNTASSAPIASRSRSGRSDILITALIEQGVRSSFNFARKGVTADIGHTISRRHNVRVNYQVHAGDDKDLRPRVRP